MIHSKSFFTHNSINYYIPNIINELLFITALYIIHLNCFWLIFYEIPKRRKYNFVRKFKFLTLLSRYSYSELICTKTEKLAHKSKSLFTNSKARLRIQKLVYESKRLLPSSKARLQIQKLGHDSKSFFTIPKACLRIQKFAFKSKSLLMIQKVCSRYHKFTFKSKSFLTNRKVFSRIEKLK